jgi:hypothetical protein
MALIEAGVCIYLPDKWGRKTRLHVILNDPYGDPPTVGLVSLSSTVKTDTTTILSAEEHSFYLDKKDRTYVVYPWMQCKDATKLEAEVNADMSMRHHHTCSKDLLKRIQDGIFESPHVNERTLRYYGAALDRWDDAMRAIALLAPTHDS